MDFANYRYLIYVLAAGTIALAFFVAYLFHRRRVLKGIVRDVRLRSTLLVYSPSVRAAKTVIVAACIILFCIAVLRPRWGETARR